MSRRPAVALVARLLLLWAVVAGILLAPEQFSVRGFPWRPLAYLPAVAVTPLLWLVLRRPRRYPIVLDLLVLSPLVVDLAVVGFDLLERGGWWPDTIHAVMWLLVGCAAGFALRAWGVERWTAAALVLPLGLTTAVAWEILEDAAGIHDSVAAIAYRDMMGDLALSLMGSLVATALTAGVPDRNTSTGSSSAEVLSFPTAGRDAKSGQAG